MATPAGIRGRSNRPWFQVAGVTPATATNVEAFVLVLPSPPPEEKVGDTAGAGDGLEVETIEQVLGGRP